VTFLLDSDSLRSPSKQVLPKRITNDRIKFSGKVVSNCYGGIIIGSQDMTHGAAVRMIGVPRYLGDHEAAKKRVEENQLDG